MEGYLFCQALISSEKHGNVNRRIRRLFMELGPDCEELIRGCKNKGSVFDCCAFAVPVLDMLYGKCFLLRSLPCHTVVGTGYLLVSEQKDRT